MRNAGFAAPKLYPFRADGGKVATSTFACSHARCSRSANFNWFVAVRRYFQQSLAQLAWDLLGQDEPGGCGEDACGGCGEGKSGGCGELGELRFRFRGAVGGLVIQEMVVYECIRGCSENCEEGILGLVAGVSVVHYCYWIIPSDFDAVVY